jgi:hypothetical protein
MIRAELMSDTDLIQELTRRFPTLLVVGRDMAGQVAVRFYGDLPLCLGLASLAQSVMYESLKQSQQSQPSPFTI